MEGDNKRILLFVFFLGLFAYCDARRLGTPNKLHDVEGSTPVTLSINEQYATMDNRILQVTLAIPGGHVLGIKYGGLDNVLDPRNKEVGRGYWDVFWTTEFSQGQEWFHLQNFRVIRNDENQVELSFWTKWNGDPNAIPANIDNRFIMLRGSSGFYNYVVLDHQDGWPATNISQIRVAYKPHRDKFHFMAVSDDIQRVMPGQKEIKSGQTLAYREATLWTNYTDPIFRTQVDDKYQYTQEMKDQQVHGWISSEENVGFWVIKATTEFYSAGPFKQELTSHLGPTCLVAFLGGHYVGDYLQISIEDGEPWTKVVGPYFVYLNKASPEEQDPHKQLWNMAKYQLQAETEKWPYDFPASEAYVKANQRGSVAGRLLIRDGHMNEKLTPASSAWVGLAAPGEAGSWQTETKGYQFWTKADDNGNFIIKAVNEGEYSLYAWVPGYIGDYKYQSNILVVPGNQINLGEIIYEAPRNGPTLWEIGIPDRTAAEFFVPDPRPDLTNPVFLNNQKNKFRQYGLWDRYTDLNPDQDLIFTIGVSDYRKDWFFAHVTRRISDGQYQPTTWQIRFTLGDVNPFESYTLRLVLASASVAEVQVRFNDFSTWSRPQFTTRRIGWDNAIARHGIHGLNWFFSFEVPPNLLQSGMNTLYLTQPRAAGPFNGVMYDYIRLEAPSF